MDKKLLAGLALLLAAACTNDMPYTPKDAGDKLIMNALMSNDEQTHAVILSLSRTGIAGNVKGPASVTFSVNGEAPEQAQEISPAGVVRSYYDSPRAFGFAADFKPGDKVTLTASALGMKATSTVTLLSAPVVVSVDTASVNDGGRECLSFAVEMEDRTPGTDYYSLEIHCRYRADFYDGDDFLWSVEDEYFCDPDFSGDIILSEEGVVAGEMDDMGFFDFGTVNRYGAFLDNQFDCGKAVLRAKVSKYYLIPGLWGGESGDGRIATRAEIFPEAVVKVSHIPVRHYYYLKAMNSLEGGMSDLSLEEIAIPDNVDGGIGFVGLSNTVTKSFSLKSSKISFTVYDDSE